MDLMFLASSQRPIEHSSRGRTDDSLVTSLSVDPTDTCEECTRQALILSGPVVIADTLAVQGNILGNKWCGNGSALAWMRLCVGTLSRRPLSTKRCGAKRKFSRRLSPAVHSHHKFGAHARRNNPLSSSLLLPAERGK